jgi:hypothetical protein
MNKKFILLILIFLMIFAFIFLSWLDINRKTRLGLEGFYELTLKDPLFYSSLFDSEEFGKAILRLEESENQLKEVAIENSKASVGNEGDSYSNILKESNVFPHQFLESLIPLNQKTNDFLKNPSVKLAEDLLDLYDVAADFYLEDISSLIRVLGEKEVEREVYTASDTSRLIASVDSFSSFDVVKNDFLTIKENGHKLKEEIAKRRSCLSGKEDCRALLKVKDNTSFIASLCKEFDQQGERVDFVKDMFLNFVPNEISEAKGPYEIKSSCWQGPDSTHWLYLIYTEQDGRISALPKLATQNYYRKVSAFVRAAGTKEQEAFLEQGLEFIFMTDTPTYQCMDVSFYPQLLAMDFIKEQIESGQVAQEELEGKLDYKLLIENQFGLLAPAINAASSHLDIMRKHAEINKSIPSLAYVFTVRTVYSIFYFPFAESIWRIDKELQYFLPEEKKPAQRGPTFFTLDELEELGYTREQIKEFHIDYIHEFLDLLLLGF